MPSDSYELFGGRYLMKGDNSITVGIKNLPVYLLSGHAVSLYRISEVKL